MEKLKVETFVIIAVINGELNFPAFSPSIQELVSCSGLRSFP